ncbi:MAG: Hsp20 family protein, partial [Terrisporobacter sp.]
GGMFGGQGNNNIMNMLSGMMGNQGGNNMGGMFGGQGNNNIMNMLSGMMGNQGGNNMGGMYGGQGNNVINNTGGMQSNQVNNTDLMNMLNSILTGQVSNNSQISNNNNNARGSSRKSKNRKNNKAVDFNNDFANSFNQLFNQTFAAVVNNQDIIENIVDTVLNSDLVEGMLEDVEKLDGMNIELRDLNDKYLIEGKLPGVNKKDIDLDYDEETLTVKVKSNQLFTNGRNRMVAIVQPSSDIEKKFIVNGVDTDKISAVFKSDMLSICLPKKNKQIDTTPVIDVDNYI